MLTSLTFTICILQIEMCNFEFYCLCPQWYLRYIHCNKKIWTFTSTVSKEMNNLPRLPWILMGNWAVACYSCVWFYPTTESTSGGWIRVAADPILRLTQVPAAGYKLRLILSCSWLEFWLLNTSCGWFSPTVDSSSGGWIRVAADYIMWLARIPAVGYKLRLIPSHGWLEFQQLDTSCGWFHPTAVPSSGGWIPVVGDSILWLTRVPAARYELLQLIPFRNWLWLAVVLSCSWYCWLDLTSGWLIL